MVGLESGTRSEVTTNPLGAGESALDAAKRLTPETARSWTDEVKRDAALLGVKLKTLHDGGAHLALGYASWGEYFEAEFGQSSRQGYRLLDAARVRELVSSDPWVTDVDLSFLAARPSATESVEETAPADVVLPNERQARALAPLLDEPAQLREAWREAQSDPRPLTAEVVREHVEQQRGLAGVAPATPALDLEVPPGVIVTEDGTRYSESRVGAIIAKAWLAVADGHKAVVQTPGVAGLLGPHERQRHINDLDNLIVLAKECLGVLEDRSLSIVKGGVS